MTKNTLLITGILSIIGGLLALFNPMAATLVVEQLAAFFFIFIAISLLYVAWSARGFLSTKALWLWGILCLLLGGYLLFEPMKGLVAITIVVAVLFIMSGISRLTFAFSVKGTAYFWPSILSGVLSVVLAMMIFFDIPQMAMSILGIFLGIELLSNGIVFMALSKFFKSKI